MSTTITAEDAATSLGNHLAVNRHGKTVEENTVAWLDEHHITVPAPYTAAFLAHQLNDHIEDNTIHDDEAGIAFRAAQNMLPRIFGPVVNIGYWPERAVDDEPPF